MSSFVLEVSMLISLFGFRIVLQGSVIWMMRSAQVPAEPAEPVSMETVWRSRLKAHALHSLTGHHLQMEMHCI